MKNSKDEILKEDVSTPGDKKMTRKDAIRKSGFIALSAATTLILLGSPNKAAAQTSPSGPPPWP